MSQMLPELFDALGGDAAQAMEDAAGADARFFERTAENEETALSRIAENERQLTSRVESIGENASKDAGEAAGLRPDLRRSSELPGRGSDHLLAQEARQPACGRPRPGRAPQGGGDVRQGRQGRVLRRGEGLAEQAGAAGQA